MSNDDNNNQSNNSNKRTQRDVVDLTTTDKLESHEEDEQPTNKKQRSSSSLSRVVIMSLMRPQTDPFIVAMTGATTAMTMMKRKCVMYLCCNEDSSSDNNKFQNGLVKCRENCAREIHNYCFQQDQTRHVTLWDGFLDNLQVSEIYEKCQATDLASKLPVKVDFQPGWKDWKYGNYISLTEASTQTLMSTIFGNNSSIMGNAIMGGKFSCNHLSLYRKRGRRDKVANTEFARVRKALDKYDWGTLDGISIRIKIVGAPYDECKVLAEVSP